MSFDVLQDKIRAMKNPTVAGLDARIEYVPEHIRKAAFEEYGVGLKGACEAIYQFNVGLIDALCDIVPAVKPQSAYYENLGWQGMGAPSPWRPLAHGTSAPALPPPVTKA